MKAVFSHFPQFNLSFEKAYLFTKIPKYHPKFTQKRQTAVMVISMGHGALFGRSTA